MRKYSLPLIAGLVLAPVCAHAFNGAIQSGSSGLYDGAVSTSTIRDGSVTTAKLAQDAVTNVAILDGTIGTGKYADGSIGTSKLASGVLSASSVDTTKIQSGAVDTSKILDGAIAYPRFLMDGIVQTPKLGDGAVGTSKLDSGAVTSAAIIEGAVGTGKIAAFSIPQSKLALTGLSVDGFVQFNYNSTTAKGLYMKNVNTGVNADMFAEFRNNNDKVLDIIVNSTNRSGGGTPAFTADGTSIYNSGVNMAFVNSVSGAPVTFFHATNTPMLRLDSTNGMSNYGQATFTSSVTVQGVFGILQTNKVGFDSITMPDRLGSMAQCTDCTMPYDTCISTSVSVKGSWRAMLNNAINQTTKIGCGSGE